MAPRLAESRRPALWQLALAAMVALAMTAGPAATLPSPDPSARPSPGPTAASPSPGPSPVPSTTPSPPPPSALPAPAPIVATLSADWTRLAGLRSLAVTGVATASGWVKVIELVSQSSTLQSLDLQQPCVGHARVRTAAAAVRASGGVTLDLTAIRVTVLGEPLTLVAADLPEGQLDLPGVPLPPLPTDTLFLSVTMFVLTIRAGAMALDGLRISSTAC